MGFGAVLSRLLCREASFSSSPAGPSGGGACESRRNPQRADLHGCRFRPQVGSEDRHAAAAEAGLPPHHFEGILTTRHILDSGIHYISAVLALRSADNDLEPVLKLSGSS